MPIEWCPKIFVCAPTMSFAPRMKKKIKRKDPKILRVQKISPPKIIGKGGEKTMIWWCLISAASATSKCSIFAAAYAAILVLGFMQLLRMLCSWCCIFGSGAASLQLVMLYLCSWWCCFSAASASSLQEVQHFCICSWGYICSLGLQLCMLMLHLRSCLHLVLHF